MYRNVGKAGRAHAKLAAKRRSQGFASDQRPEPVKHLANDPDARAAAIASLQAHPVNPPRVPPPLAHRLTAQASSLLGERLIDHRTPIVKWIPPL